MRSKKRDGSGDPIDKIGVGDQGIMIGFVCNETPEYMPMTISFAHLLVKHLAKLRKNGTLPYLGPDGKSQVTIDTRSASRNALTPSSSRRNTPTK